MHLVSKREQSPLEIALDLAQALRDVLHEINLDDPGDHEAHNAPRLSRAEEHATAVVQLLREVR
jgi:hypothetical protein